MGKVFSKGQPKEPPKEPETKDDRWPLSRLRTSKWSEYWAKKAELQNREVSRPIGNSTYWRELPIYQAWWFHIGLIAFVFRKMPFTNPFARVLFFLLGVDLCRARTMYVTLSSHESRKYYQQFDRLHEILTKTTTLRWPDYKEESEDWYEMNKPAYRVPVPWEYTLDAYMRFFIINAKKFGQRPVEWEGKWEQEIDLNMDLYAPHADHWYSIH